MNKGTAYVHAQRERDRANGVKYFRVRCTQKEFDVMKSVIKAGGFSNNGDATVSLFYEKAKELGIDVLNPLAGEVEANG